MPAVTMDPCPRCGVVPTSIETEPETIVSNPTSVFPAEHGMPAMVNPAPDPSQDQFITVDTWTTFEPCCHTFSAGELKEAGWEYRVADDKPDLPKTMTVEELRRAMKEMPPGTRLRVAYA